MTVEVRNCQMPAHAGQVPHRHHPQPPLVRAAIALCNIEELDRTGRLHGPFVNGNAPCPRHMKEARLAFMADYAAAHPSKKVGPVGGSRHGVES